MMYSSDKTTSFITKHGVTDFYADSDIYIAALTTYSNFDFNRMQIPALYWTADGGTKTGNYQLKNTNIEICPTVFYPIIMIDKIIINPDSLLKTKRVWAIGSHYHGCSYTST